MMPLDPHAANRLAKVVGLFASDSAGERDAAVVRATAVLRSCGLDWQQLVRLAAGPAAPPPPPVPREAPHVTIARWALSFPAQLTRSEREFLTNILRKKAVSPRQRAWLETIADELHQGGAR
ncbi:hypothetical protein [Roseomonas marmotae]|uniref:DUF533 domain-containing protein n=1 Tax=Roseomonas marmotae TaxID=2768161 RepID=A0ABS3K7D4_9PROT|nr:hypothetical protein [Roseomonas marmotae]MBO1073362.1 hypothetical protein [Roseomonas marmotae]